MTFKYKTRYITFISGNDTIAQMQNQALRSVQISSEQLRVIGVIRTSELRKVLVIRMNIIDKIALTLSVVGALVWGCIGIFGFNIVGWLFDGDISVMSRIVYTLVGLSGIWTASLIFRSFVPEDERVIRTRD